MLFFVGVFISFKPNGCQMVTCSILTYAILLWEWFEPSHHTAGSGFPMFSLYHRWKFLQLVKSSTNEGLL